MRVKGVRGELYFHILESDRKLQYGDRREVVPGKELKMPGSDRLKPVLCERGMHASKEINDARQYSYIKPEKWVCIVRLNTNVIHDFDKSVAKRRIVVAMRQIKTWIQEDSGTFWNSDLAYKWVMAKPWNPNEQRSDRRTRVKKNAARK